MKNEEDSLSLFFFSKFILSPSLPIRCIIQRIAAASAVASRSPVGSSVLSFVSDELKSATFSGVSPPRAHGRLKYGSTKFRTRICIGNSKLHAKWLCNYIFPRSNLDMEFCYKGLMGEVYGVELIGKIVRMDILTLI